MEFSLRIYEGIFYAVDAAANRGFALFLFSGEIIFKINLRIGFVFPVRLF